MNHKQLIQSLISQHIILVRIAVCPFYKCYMICPEYFGTRARRDEITKIQLVTLTMMFKPSVYFILLFSTTAKEREN